MLAKFCFFPAKAADPETGTTFNFLNADAWGALGGIGYWRTSVLAHKYSHSQRMVQTA
jgi:hypothetical protein